MDCGFNNSIVSLLKLPDFGNCIVTLKINTLKQSKVTGQNAPIYTQVVLQKYSTEIKTFREMVRYKLLIIHE